jgi:hypothetical protein
MPGSVERFTGRVGEVVLSGVDRAVEHRWEAALEQAASLVGSTEDRVAEATRASARELAAVGAAAGGAAAVPGIGIVTAAGAAATELTWFTTRSADLILTIAAVHGHTEATVEQRRAWILSVLAFGDSASTSFAAVATQLGKGIGSRAKGGIPATALRSANRVIGRALVRRYGSRRAAVALGRAVPFGIGAAIGGKANHTFARMVGRQADAFFRELPPPLVGAAGPTP